MNISIRPPDSLIRHDFAYQNKNVSKEKCQTIASQLIGTMKITLVTKLRQSNYLIVLNSCKTIKMTKKRASTTKSKKCYKKIKPKEEELKGSIL